MYQYIFNPRTRHFDAISEMDNDPDTYINIMNASTGKLDAVSNLGTQYTFMINTRTMKLDKILWYPPNKAELLLFLTFTVINVAGTNYFKDLSPLGLHALALTTTTPYDSIALNTDIRIQNACNSAGCFTQFFNGAIPDVSNTAKTVLLTDISQLYLDNYIFSNVPRNIFLIYSAEQVNSVLSLILDRVGARIKKVSSWGTDTGSLVSLKYGNDHIVTVPNTAEYIISYNIRTKTKETYGTLTTTSNTKFNYGTIVNNHLICFPYNYTKLIDVDLVGKTISEYGDFSALAAGRFNSGSLVSQKLLNNGKIIAIPRSATYIAIYDPSDNSINTFGTITASSGNNKFIGFYYQSDSLITLVPSDYNTIINIDAINQTIETYGSLQAITNKYFSYHVINSDLIACIPRSANSVLLIHPISKTVETFGSFTGTNLYYYSILLASGKILAVPQTATQLLLIDPVAKTTTLFGTSFGATTFKYITNLIELTNGHVIAFPGSANSIIDIDPVNQTYEIVKDLGATLYKFYESVNYNDFTYNISDNQILAYPYGFSNILDFNQISRELFKLGYFFKATPSGLKFVRTIINDGSKRLIHINSTDFTAVLDIELR